MTNEIQQFRYDQLMRRVNGIIGPGSKVSEVLTELFPVLDVERIPGELMWLAGWRLAWAGGSISAAAGQTSRIQLFNPVGSGKIISVTNVIVTVSVNSPIFWTTTNVLFPTTVAPQRLRDTRRGAFEAATAEVRTFSAVGTTVATNQAQILVSQPLELNDPNEVAILFPGTALEVGMSVVASTLRVSFRWRERIFEESELTGV